MKNKLFITLCFVLFICKTGVSQLRERYEKGIITTKEGKKLHGFIRNDDFKHKVTKICFKEALDEKNCNIYGISEIISFTTDIGESYELFTIKINNLSKEVTLFAEKLLESKTSLYKSMYNDLVFYIVKKEDKNYILQKDKLISGDLKIKRYNYLGILSEITENFSIEENNEAKFKEQYFIDRLSKYNNANGDSYEIVKAKEKPIKFINFSTGLGLGGNNHFEYFAQLNKRIYYPSFSKNSSLNIGLNYYNYQYTESRATSLGGDLEVTQTLISIPLQLQYNFGHKRFRPFVFTGANIGFFSKKDQNKNSLLEDSGLQESFGVSFLFGAGMEIDIYKNFYLKGEFRHETFDHLFLFGLGYAFELSKK